MIIGTCRNCVRWQEREGLHGWGECMFAHRRMYVKFPEELNVPLGVSDLLTMPDFGCAEFVRRRESAPQ